MAAATLTCSVCKVEKTKAEHYSKSQVKKKAAAKCRLCAAAAAADGPAAGGPAPEPPLRSPRLSAAAAPFQPPFQPPHQHSSPASRRHYRALAARKNVDCYLWSKAVFSGKRPADRSCEKPATPL